MTQDELIQQLKQELAWAWDRLGKTKDYTDFGYGFCVVCGAPEWAHKPTCTLHVHYAQAQALLNETL